MIGNGTLVIDKGLCKDCTHSNGYAPNYECKLQHCMYNDYETHILGVGIVDLNMDTKTLCIVFDGKIRNVPFENVDTITIFD